MERLLEASKAGLKSQDLWKVIPVSLSNLIILIIVTDYLKGTMKIDEYVTHHRTLANINEGFHDMHVSYCCIPQSDSTDLPINNRAGVASVVLLICLKPCNHVSKDRQ